MLTPVSMVNERKKVIVPEVGALPTLAIWNVYDPRTPGNKVVGPVMLGVRSGTGVVVVVVVVVGGTVVVVVVDGAPVVVVVVAGAGTAAGGGGRARVGVSPWGLAEGQHRRPNGQGDDNGRTAAHTTSVDDQQGHDAGRDEK